jgi:hypothetical protein
VFIPDTSIERSGDIGARAHTNHKIFAGPAKGLGSAGGLGPSGGMTPNQVRAFYGVPFTTTAGSGVIVIIDAYDYATALSDFNVFSSQFGLPLESPHPPLGGGFAGQHPTPLTGSWGDSH